MADDDLRELERTWLASGALEDGVAWHRARLRSGVVDREGLRRAAVEGDRAAWVVADDPPPVLIRLDTWLRANAPEALAGFNPPATEAELAQAEAALGQPLPPLLRAIYLWRNGQPRRFVAVDDELEPSEQETQRLAGFSLDPPQLDDQHLTVFPSGWRLLSIAELRSAWESRIQPRPEHVLEPWPAHCVPFMTLIVIDGPVYSGELRCVDPVGGKTTQAGQVVEGSDGMDVIAAPSLTRWLEAAVAALEQGAGGGATPRLEYFQRAVLPGYPLAVRHDEGDPLRAVYDRTLGDLVSSIETNSCCLFLLALPPAFLLALWARTGNPGLTQLLGWGGAALLALLIPVALHLRDRLRHRKLTNEFANATLDPPPEGR